MVQTGLERGSHPLGGTIFGAPLKLHWTFWFNFLFQVAYSVISFSSSWKYILLIAIIWGPFCLLMIYLHELGHLWVNRRYGGDCSLAVLWPLGGFSICCIEKCTCMQEFWVALAGPATHSVQFIIWVIVMSISSEWGTSYYNHGFNFSRFDNGGASKLWFLVLTSPCYFRLRRMKFFVCPFFFFSR
jgi:Zn-dependent protease